MITGGDAPVAAPLKEQQPPARPLLNHLPVSAVLGSRILEYGLESGFTPTRPPQPADIVPGLARQGVSFQRCFHPKIG